jgi:hypothetical protein
MRRKKYVSLEDEMKEDEKLKRDVNMIMEWM